MLFNFLFARRHQGVFILRIEDTDRERSRKEFEDDIIEHLAWLGISWDEFHRQSERLESHKAHLQKLLETKKAFYCAHAKEELEAEHHKQAEHKEIPRHVCTQRDEGREEGIIRLRNDAMGNLTFKDLIRGDIAFDASLLGDISIARTLESPLYNFVVVVDDAQMQITHVIRGEDHIPNTPKQLLIQQALGFTPPLYAHLPLLLGSDRSKLSKRHGDTAMHDYRAEGYLPEAMINFMALLGWNPALKEQGSPQGPKRDREIFTMDELIKEFSLEKVQKAGAIFNEEKLAWINHAYIQKFSVEKLAEHLKPFIEKTGMNVSPELTRRIAHVEQPRLSRLKDIEEHIALYTEPPVYERELLPWKGTQDYDEIKNHLAKGRILLCDIVDEEFCNLKRLEDALMPYAAAHGKGNVLWPLRAALSGREKSPGPFEIMYVIGKEETIRRIDNALQLITSAT